MAVAVDVAGTEQGSASANPVTSFNYTGITVGSGSNRALLAAIALSSFGGSDGTAVSAIWDSGGSNQAMSLLLSVINPANNDPIFIFGLRNPVSGNKTLAFSWSNSVTPCANAVAFTGVEQSSDGAAFPHTVTNSATNSSATATVTSATGNYCFAVCGASAGLSANSDTKFMDNVTAGLYTDGDNSFGSYGTGASSKTMTFTLGSSVDWVEGIVDIAAAGASDTLFVGGGVHFI